MLSTFSPHDNWLEAEVSGGAKVIGEAASPNRFPGPRMHFYDSGAETLKLQSEAREKL